MDWIHSISSPESEQLKKRDKFLTECHLLSLFLEDLRNQLQIIVTTFMKTQTNLISFFYYMKIRINCKCFSYLKRLGWWSGRMVDLRKNPGYMPRSFLISKNVLPPIRIRSNPMMTEWSIGTNIVNAPNPMVDNDITYIE